jgi:hypothetical protein
MDFEPGKRLNVVTGDNGLGKSFLLDLAWWAVTRHWSGAEVRPPLDGASAASVDIEFAAVTRMAKLAVTFDRADQVWRFPKGQPGQPGLVVYARVDGDFAVWDSNRRFGGEDVDPDFPRALVFGRDHVWNSLSINGKPICNGLLADWVSWQQTTAWEFGALSQALTSLSPSPDELITAGPPTRVDVLESRLIPTLRMPYGQDVPITVASAGMKRVIALAYLLVWAWREHLEISRITGRETAERMLVIIDEVEAHLHPKWQRIILSSIIESLTRLTRPTGSERREPKIQYIVATHSPLVLTSVEQLFDPLLDKMFDLRLDLEQHPPAVVLDSPEFRKRGDADSWLTSDAFGLKSSRSAPAEAVIERAAELMRASNPPDDAIIRMQSELEGVLADTDSFWTRWRAVQSARRTSA